jgi:hypothetical protein
VAARSCLKVVGVGSPEVRTAAGQPLPTTCRHPGSGRLARASAPLSRTLNPYKCGEPACRRGSAEGNSLTWADARKWPLTRPFHYLVSCTVSHCFEVSCGDSVGNRGRGMAASCRVSEVLACSALLEVELVGLADDPLPVRVVINKYPGLRSCAHRYRPMKDLLVPARTIGTDTSRASRWPSCSLN